MISWVLVVMLWGSGKAVAIVPGFTSEYWCEKAEEKLHAATDYGFVSSCLEVR